MQRETNNNKKAGIAVIISDKIHFKAKTVTRDKDIKDSSSKKM